MQQMRLNAEIIYTSEVLTEGVRLCKHNKSEWIVIPELRLGTGFIGDSEQRIDLFAFHEWPSHNNKTISYEMKISRGDFLRELRLSEKRKPALRKSTRFYFVTPPDLVKKKENPEECGLIEIFYNPEGVVDSFNCKRYPSEKVQLKYKYISYEKVVAPKLKREGASWNFVAGLVRRTKNDFLQQEKKSLLRSLTADEWIKGLTEQVPDYKIFSFIKKMIMTDNRFKKSIKRLYNESIN